MSSGGQRIRRAVVAGLKAAHTRAGQRVYGNRTRPVWKDDMPVILVFTREERAELFQVSPKVYRRTLQLGIEIVDTDQGEPEDLVDDRLDELAEQVERFVFRDPKFGLGAEGPEFEVEDTLLESVDLVLFEEAGRPGERPLAGQLITFSVRYLVEALEGSSEDLEALNGVDIEWRLKPGDAIVDARDRVDLQGS